MEIANASMLDESTAAAEAMTLIRRSTKHASSAFFVDAETHPQTIAVVAARAEPIGVEVVVGDLADARPVDGVRRAAAAPRHHRCGARPLPHHRRRARGRRARRRRHRPAGLHARHPARRAGRRRVRRLVAALRRAARLRRSPRRVPRHPRRAPPVDAGPAGRRVGRRRRAPRPPPRAADPRAAHPSGEGDLEHLHRAGAARGHRLDVRRVPRPRRAAAHRRAGARPGRAPGRHAARRRCRGGARRVLRHPRRPRAAAEPTRSSPRRWSSGVNLRRSTPTPSASPSTRPPPTTCSAAWPPRSAPRPVVRSAVVALPTALAPHHRLPHPPGVQHAPLRDRAAPLPAARSPTWTSRSTGR